MDVGAWLRGLGLGRYEQAFRDNDLVDADLIARLTGEDLTALGVASVGHRRRLLDAVSALPRPDAPPGAGTAPGAGSAEPAAGAGAADPARLEGERRQLTVMFADLVGSTALSTRLDLEDLRDLIAAYHACVAEAVARAGGFVAKYMGDGVLAYFGYPRAHEDDAERAIRAALDAVAAVRNVAPRSGGALQARVGVATGLVVVGDLIGQGASRERAVVGDTPNLAARLQAVAEAGAVVIAAGTRRLVGGLFECVDLGVVAVKGFAEPVRAYRVLGAGAAASRFDALHAGTLTPLVGREAEVGLLLGRWREAESGAGRVVLLVGEPGVGKSRLVAAAAERLHDEAPHVDLRYSCSPHRQDSPLHPITAQLANAAGFARDDPSGTKLAKLEALLARASAPAEDVALLAELLSIPAGDRRPVLPLAPRRKRERTFEALLRRLEGLADRAPVLMTFEDAHWIDPSSRELLDLIVGRSARLRVLLLVTCRPGFRAPWTDRPNVTALCLDRPSAGATPPRWCGGSPAPPRCPRERSRRSSAAPTACRCSSRS